MPGKDKMLRVTKKNPCPVCGKPDWCLVSQDRSAVICPRVEEGSVKKCGDAGYLHILRDRHNGHNRHRRRVNKRRLVTTVPTSKNCSRDFGQLAIRYSQQLTDEELNGLASALGVSTESLKRLDVGWDGQAHMFPMSNDFGKTIGIRRRFPNGRKASVNGSRIGLFIPSDLPPNGPLLICEGPSDAAAALDLGFAAIGRPSCNSGTDLMLRFVKVRDVVIVGDNDDAGRTGAEKLGRVLALHCPSVKVIYPPQTIKDLRQWLISGLTSVALGDAVSAIRPIKLRTKFNHTRTGTKAS